MIAEIYIESAKNIRNKFLKLTKKLNKYEKEAAELVIILETKAEELKSFSEDKVSKIRDKTDIAKVGEEIIKKINEVEEKEQQLLRLIKPINDEMDILRRDEEILFSQIKERYPNLSQQDIIQEIHSHL